MNLSACRCHRLYVQDILLSLQKECTLKVLHTADVLLNAEELAENVTRVFLYCESKQKCHLNKQ